MELKRLSPEQTTWVYETLLLDAFPPAELKPLAAMLEMEVGGLYLPYGFFDGETIIGACFLWLGDDGVALIDHLCVSPLRRNEGLGEAILAQMQQLYPTWVLMAESEYPPLAENPSLAERRLGFYRRNHGKTADFRSRIFGVAYSIFYWGDALTQDQYRQVYVRSFTGENLEKYVVVPDVSEEPVEQVRWEQ